MYILDGKSKTAAFNINLARLSKLKIDPVFIHAEKDFPVAVKDQVIVDALFGTGLNRPLKNAAAQLVCHINAQKNNAVISIDLPSGLLADGATTTGAIVKATHTLSFETSKLAFFLPSNLFLYRPGTLAANRP